jgi:hypothetical protein
MKSTKVIIKNTTQRIMAKYGFERRFHDLKYFEVGLFPFILLEFNINLMSSLQKFVGKYQFNVFYYILNIF